MLKIKLARFGKRNQPHYRIVVNEAKSKRDGQYTALLVIMLRLKLQKFWNSISRSTSFG